MDLTEVEKGLLEKLGDGKRYRWYELKDDPLDTKNQIKQRVHHLRNKLEPRGLGILTEYYYSAYYYRMVQFISRSE